MAGDGATAGAATSARVGVSAGEAIPAGTAATAGEAECRALAGRIEAEVRRLEAVFNRHDPASPVAALNRCRLAEGSGRVAGSGSSGVAAGSGSGRVRAKVADDDLWFLLEIGEQFRKATFGYFDLAALSNREALLQATPMNAAEAPFRLLHSTHEIELRRGCILDFGGIAKGYALEKVRNILKAAGVENALLNFGGSSVLGMGHHPLGPCWEVAPEGTPPSAPSLNTPQFRDGNPETAEPFLKTAQSRNHSPETAEPFLKTAQNRNHSPETIVPFLETAQSRNHSPETAEPFLETTHNRNRTPVFRLRDSALSVSGRDREGREHIVDPHTSSPAHHPAAASTNRIAPHTGRPTTQTIPTGRPAPNTGTTPQATRPATGSAPTSRSAVQDSRPTTPDGLPATQEDRIPPHPTRIAVTGRSALVCEILSTALYAAPKELQNEIIANFEGYTTLAP